jgi:glutathione S-transferase
MELRRDSPSEAWLARQRHKVSAATQWLAEQIGDREFAVRDTFGQADIAIGVNLALLTFAHQRGGRIEQDHWCDRLPTLARYVKKLEARPSFQATRPQMMDSGMQDAIESSNKYVEAHGLPLEQYRQF